MRSNFIALAGAVALAGSVAAVAPAAAEPALLRGASCFPQGSYFSKRFERFVERVNAADGVVRIQYLGGAPAIGSPFSLVQKMAQGVYDIANCTGAYYQNVVPEADAWKLLERDPAEIRANGGWALMEAIHRRNNLVPLARIHYGTPFHLFLGPGHAIDRPDLTGLHLRVAPIYTNFFKAAGATTQTSTLAEIYSLMENGTVQGFGWPITGLQPGWETVTAYRVDPGFYDADIEILVNAEAWDALPGPARAAITFAALEAEAAAPALDAVDVAAARAKQAEQFETITFTGADAETWLGTARDAGWAGVIETSPEDGARLRPLFAAQ